MASRVNTKLVVALIVGVVLVCAAGIGLYSFVLKSGPEDNVADGDRAMAAGDYVLAKRMYGRAVNKNQNNVEWLNKLRSAMEAWRPESETAFLNEFSAVWIPLLRGLAYAQPTEVEASDEYLSLRYRLALMHAFPAQQVSLLEQETTALVSLMAGAAPADMSRHRLRRYRALATVELARAGQPIPPADLTKTQEDLLAVLDNEPGDGQARVALSLLEQTAAREELASNRWTGYVERIGAAQEILADHLVEDADDPDVVLNAMLTDLDFSIEEARRETVGAARARAFADVYASYRDDLEMLYEALQSTEEPVEDRTIRMFSRAEAFVEPDSRATRTLVLTRELVAENPDAAGALAYLAEILKSRGELVEAMATLDTLTALKAKPVGYEGMLQMRLQTVAYMEKAEIALTESRQGDVLDEAGRAESLARAKTHRAEYAARVPESDIPLLFLDARLLEADGDLRGALTLLQRYNQLLPPADGARRLEGLWAQGQLAGRLQEYGRARSSFQEMLTIQSENPQALMALAEAERALRNLPAALDHYRTVAALLPGNEAVTEQIRGIEVQLGLTSSDDPVEQALADAANALNGNAERPGSRADAIEVLRRAIEINGYSARLSRELASHYLASGDLANAREVTTLAAEANPEDEVIGRILGALQTDNMLDANIALIESAPISEVDKAINVYQVLLRFEEPERALEMLERANEIAPDNPTVTELRFLDAIARSDLERARKVYEDANAAGALGDDALVYRARIEAAEGRTQDAIVTLTQAIETGATRAPVYRLLGTQLQAANLNQRALEAFATAYQIKPDDTNNAISLAQMLYVMGRGSEALAVAREAERFGRDNPAFMNMWLSLEAREGGEEGLARAITVREQITRTRPDDRTNREQLAQLYIDVASRTTLAIPEESRREHWAKARGLIDELQSEERNLGTVVLEARWLADQGRVPQADGTTIDGIEAARGVFIEYIIGLGDEATADPYMELAAFMSARGRYGVAEGALIDARQYQGSDMSVEKVLGQLYMELKQFRAAAEAFEKVVEAGADDERASYRIRWVEMLLKMGEYEQALEQLDALPAGLRDELTTVLQRAEAADGMNNGAEAAALFDRAVALFPGATLSYTRRAEYRLRDPALIEDVLADLGQALAINPTDTQTLQLRASVYGQQKRYDDMLADLVSSLRTDPTNTRVLVSVMLEYLLRKEDGRAMDIADETLRKRPRDLMLIATAAKVFEDRSYWERAADLFRRGFEMSGDHGFGLAYINALISQEPPRTREAEAVMRQLRAQAGAAREDWQVDFADGAIRYTAGERAQGEQIFAQIFSEIADTPNHLVTWWGDLTSLYGEDDAARNAFVRGLVERSDSASVSHVWARFFLAQSLSQEESTVGEAIEIYQSLEELGESSPFARLAYRQHGSVLYAHGRYEEAVTVWTAGLEVFPGDWEMCNNAAFALATELDNMREALPFALSAVEAAPQQAEAHDSLARVHIGLGDYEKATDSLSSARRYAQTERSNVSIAVTQAELDIQEGKLTRARRSLERLLLGVSLVPEMREQFESDIQAMLRRIDSLEE